MTRQSAVIDLEVEFPVLCFQKGTGALWVAPDWKYMTITTPNGLRAGALTGMLVVDSDRYCVTVKEAQKPDRSQWLWCIDTVLNRQIHAKLVFEDKRSQCSLDDVKRMVLESFPLAREYWEELEDWDTLPDRVQKAQSMGEIMKLFS